MVKLPVRCRTCGRERYDYGRCPCQKPPPHELVGFLAICAVNYQRQNGLNGLHPTHYDLMVKYGARMDDFKRATNAAMIETLS